ncbi:hypothetical protein [Xanthomonas hortorum]|uniref:hypothetical protein n=1 Tax=Xanthomonas hortorum TaxID=56454 RepID=UPI001F430330|nr:hypothetical protein [Xanthomonas hortorum]MCE4510321.1 hypothetical protein [Xanthomonas hortorum pv. vitians]MCE4520566.1 hypothetical protein [Xanthomonas hortorum pv. vitians]
MRFPHKRRSPREAGNVAQAGGLSAPRDYTKGAAICLAAGAMEAARRQLEVYALQTDEPSPGIVEAADLLDAARAVLDGAA